MRSWVKHQCAHHPQEGTEKSFLPRQAIVRRGRTGLDCSLNITFCLVTDPSLSLNYLPTEIIDISNILALATPYKCLGNFVVCFFFFSFLMTSKLVVFILNL